MGAGVEVAAPNQADLPFRGWVIMLVKAVIQIAYYGVSVPRFEGVNEVGNIEGVFGH
jgi:hypothetical protein